MNDTIKVELSRNDWENIVGLLTEIRDSDRVAVYIDDIVDKIDTALDKETP